MSKSLSVVVASAAGGEFLFRCLASLEKEKAAGESAEIVVVDRVGPATVERVRREFSTVRLIETAGSGRRESVPELRKRGVLAANGDVVAILEEHCTAPTGWLKTAKNGLEPGVAAIGGPILDDDYARLRDWCVYFSEYNNYLPPWPEGERFVLNGANIAYDRRTLLAEAERLDKGYWEVVLHPELAKRGRFKALPGMGAKHTGPFDFGYYLGQRYLLSRVWGGTQRSRVSIAKRIVYLVIAPILPFALFLRTALRVLKSGRRIGKFAASAPLLIIALFVYVWGEWLGYLLGPGDALERVE